jgi:methionyl aminopeptidase
VLICNFAYRNPNSANSIGRYDLCENLEAMNRQLVQAKGLERGIAFPTGVSRNYIAAHYSPNPADRNEILGEVIVSFFASAFSFANFCDFAFPCKNDVLKIDFGTQVNGHIVDCA